MSAGGLLARAKLWLLRLVSAVYGPLKIGAHLLELWWMLRPCVAERRKAAEAERAFSELIRKLPELTEPWEARLSRKREKWSGRGIVVVAGGPSYGTLAVELVRSIRAYGCRLPIEVFHLGPAERECGACDELAALDGVVLRDLLSGHPTLCEAAGFGYAAKPLAVAASSFEEVLLLDADNTCCADPSHLFECAAYREAGAVFWCDMYSSAVRPGGGGGSAASGKFVRMFDPWGVRQRPTVVEATLQDVIDRLLITPVRKRPNFDEVLSSAGLPPSQLTQESGQLLLHKGRCLRGLAAVVQLNMNSQRAVVYAGLHGDKDTFRVGFAAVRCDYHYVDSPPDLGGHVDETTGVFYDSCFVQRDVRGGLTGRASGVPRPLFLHYCGRHRGDDARRHGRPPTHYVRALGRPFRVWPADDRRGYMAAGAARRLHLARPMGAEGEEQKRIEPPMS